MIPILCGSAVAWTFGSAFALALAGMMMVAAPAHAAEAWLFGYVVAFGIGYMGGSLLNRVFVGASAGIWATAPGRWLVGRIAGMVVTIALIPVARLWADFVISAMFYAAQLIADHFHRPLQNPDDVTRFVPLCEFLLTTLGVYRWRRPAKIFIGRATRPVRRALRSLRMGLGGSAAFAGLLEEWANPWKPGMTLLGASMYDRSWLVGVADDRHFITIATNGAGKGRDAIISNLLTYPGSVICIDPKGQNCAITAAMRGKS